MMDETVNRGVPRLTTWFRQSSFIQKKLIPQDNADVLSRALRAVLGWSGTYLLGFPGQSPLTQLRLLVLDLRQRDDTAPACMVLAVNPSINAPPSQIAPRHQVRSRHLSRPGTDQPIPYLTSPIFTDRTSPSVPSSHFRLFSLL